MLKLFIIVRADLDPGLQLAQAVHAAIQWVIEDPDLSSIWHKKSNNVVVKHVADEAALLALAEKAYERGCVVEAFKEPDLDDATTAVAIVGGGANALLRDLPLARFDSARAAA
jgi:peptidyl-tRNA hydrolase